MPASAALDLPNAHEEPGYPRVVIAAAWHAYLRGDFEKLMNSAAKRSKLIRFIRERGAGLGSSWKRAT